MLDVRRTPVEFAMNEFDPELLAQASEGLRLLRSFLRIIEDVQGCIHRERVTELSWHRSENGLVTSELLTERCCQTCGFVERSPFNRLAGKRVVKLEGHKK